MAALSSGIAKDDHNVGVGRYLHLIPGVRSAGDVSESRDDRPIFATLVERLEKRSEIPVLEWVSVY
jgi:hypothetical protein